LKLHLRGGVVILVPSPPDAKFSENGTTMGDLGQYCDVEYYSFNTATVPSGPNAGYQYVPSVTPSSAQGTYGYYYVISPDLEDSANTFSKAQCGDYNASTNPNGYISQCAADTIPGRNSYM
jgi:hypothetical protein